VAGKPSRDGCPDNLLPFKVVRSNGHDEPLACAANLLIARGAYERATLDLQRRDPRLAFYRCERVLESFGFEAKSR